MCNSGRQIDRVFLEMRDMEREVHKKLEDMDRLMFKKTISQQVESIKEDYQDEKVTAYIDGMVDDMAENINII